jgi:hypothetical protein
MHIDERGRKRRRAAAKSEMHLAKNGFKDHCFARATHQFHVEVPPFEDEWGGH